MLRLRALELIQLFRQPGGAEFVHFCNEAIRAFCFAACVPQAAVSTCSRTDAKDGGVDTRVGKGIGDKDKFGYFQTSSIWQFKSADESTITESALAEEVSKPYARKCLEGGDAYRLCVCAHVPDDKKRNLEQSLNIAIKAISSSAPTAKILSIDDIVVVANSFPALIFTYRPGLSSQCLLFERWGTNISETTPVFVPNSTFAATEATIRAHVDFHNPVPDCVLTLQGVAGVGKTRTVYESLRSVPAADSLVLYTDDEDAATELATQLANDEQAIAILVADECSLVTREQLSRLLLGCRDRIRGICIDNSLQRTATAAPELAVTPVTSTELEKILRANFGEVPADRVRTYAHLAEGFVRLAADMCRYDAQIAQAGRVTPIVNRVDTYYRDRLRTEERMKAVEAIALLKRVRRKGESPTQLDALCALTKLDRNEVEQHLAAIKEAPGFVERGALYYRVTPELIAMIAFAAAWKRWAEGREEQFLSNMHETIKQAFMQRVSESASTEIREKVQGYFNRFCSWESKHLTDLQSLSTLISLIETDPENYLPTLRRIVQSATHDELTGGPEWTKGSWGPRRQLVWLAERFAQFPEFFSDCEQILFTLAKHECEPSISNNATKIWQQLFRWQLSGTAVPFPSRLELLGARLEGADEETTELLSGAIDEVLDTHGVRIVGPPLVAGRIPPPDWHPVTAAEVHACIHSGLTFIAKAARSSLPKLAAKARKAFISRTETFARGGWIDELRPIVAEAALTEDDQAKLVANLKRFASMNRQENNSGLKTEYAAKLQKWIQELEPRSFHAQLVEVVGTPAWNYYGQETQWHLRLSTLATEMLESVEHLNAECQWLSSTDASSAFEFGHALGTIDANASLFETLVQNSKNREIGFLRGYVAGLIHGARIEPSLINDCLDELETELPLFVFQIALAAGTPLRLFERAVRLIRAGLMPAYHLRSFTFWVGEVKVTNEQVLTSIELLLPDAQNGDTLCCDVMVDFLGARLHAGHFQSLMELNSRLVWDVLQIATKHPGREVFWWAQTLSAAARSNPTLAIHLAAEAMVGSNYEMSQQAGGLLCQWAKTYAADVMMEIGRLMLDAEIGWHFFVSKYPVFTALPPAEVIAWLSRVGVDGARKIARHLPRPYLDGDGKPCVPELTAHVLASFEDDDHTFAEFCAGTHSLQVYTGNIAAAREAEAERGRAFLNHPLRRIREWGHVEYQSGIADAERHREWEDEAGF